MEQQACTIITLLDPKPLLNRRDGTGFSSEGVTAYIASVASHELEKLSTLRTKSSGISASLSGVGPRYASKGEKDYLGRLVEKYGLGGESVEKMARDRKLNTEQRTEGELRRALKRAGWT
ncbi:hypothetical protein WG66_005250 [Moniliophthora roreri]|nr:hypothetical protein WG66_005250 [Moniliophthora roreri]